MLAEGFLMRFRAGLPLRAKGCAIPTKEQRPSAEIFVYGTTLVYPTKGLRVRSGDSRVQK